MIIRLSVCYYQVKDEYIWSSCLFFHDRTIVLGTNNHREKITEFFMNEESDSAAPFIVVR